MRLKKVIIQGFKSFADKTTIEIKEGITAIVGPNGSGKSNISDAIRWVLGEQSVRNLRGNKMEDIIFAGTSKRKALGYSEVSIIFDNEDGEIPLDYTEIEVTRRMFRSGESEYYLNKSSCRLKDIRELFMDTGVGKDGYSIIGQGRIEEILSNRPEDRRSIFEEAAGIVKYKVKKQEAERKLEKTDGNLLRIKDLIYELTNQLEHLEDQSNKANIFTGLYARLKELEINLFIKDIDKININLVEIEKEKKILEEQLYKEKIDKETIENSFNSLKSSIEELELKIESHRETNLQITNNLDKTQNQLEIINEKEKFNNKDILRLKEEIQDLDKNYKEIERLNLDLEKQLVSFTDEYNNLSIDYKEKSIDFEENFKMINLMEENLDKDKNNLINLYNKSSEVKSKLNTIQSFNDNINQRVIRLEKDIQLVEKDKEDKTKEYEEILVNENISKEILTNYKAKLGNINEEITEINNELESIINKINKEKLEIESKNTNLRILKNMEDGYEGYFKGVKSILKARKHHKNLDKGFVGIVADLMKVNAKFAKAIDISLGASVQNIVTYTEEDGKNIIEYLKRNNLGRVTCLPANIIKGSQYNINSSDRERFKILGLGFELIDYKKEYENIFKYLLGKTIIVENINDAIKLASHFNHSYRIITLDGEVLNPGGSMTGGSTGDNNISLISRRANIESLDKEISNILENISILEMTKNKVFEDLELSKTDILDLENKIKEEELKIVQLNNLKENINYQVSKSEETIRKYKNEIKTLNTELRDYKGDLKDTVELSQRLEFEIIEIKEKISDLTKDYGEEKSKREEKNTLLTNLKIDLNSIENKINSMKSNMNNNLLEMNKNTTDIKMKTNIISDLEINIKEITDLKERLKSDIRQLENDEKDSKTNLNDLIKEKDSVMNKFYLEQDRLIKINNEIANIEKKINQEEIKNTRLTVQLENYHKKLSDDYELQYEEALEYKKEIKNIQEAIVEARRLKIQIKELGTVNLSSIEEYKNMKSRLDFILEQQKDLINAKDSLREVIKDMEEKMKSQFIDSFRKINNNFQEVFSILFNGGKAELILEDEENILYSGIEINAQPPGKKLQSLTLLSGGEKSLTAVALLFSILKLKPSPFCILDEIDAALDEANINRYTNYLKDYFNDMQFVIITHRKTTMEIADILYGVAMEEEGISKLISVKLKDNENEIAS